MKNKREERRQQYPAQTQTTLGIYDRTQNHEPGPGEHGAEQRTGVPPGPRPVV